VTLVFPREHAVHDGALSVLTPLGAALIGLREGQSITFETLDGRTRRVTVLRVLSQPDSVGRAVARR
jgi:regulator of nucleoside diphosphate kinase